MSKKAKKRNAAIKPMLQYLMRIPKVLPKGKILVHNRVTAQPHIGKNGFRAWLADDATGMVVCDCGFGGIENSERHVHYTNDFNAGRPHWIKLPNDDAITPELREHFRGECSNPSDEIEMAFRQAILMFPEDKQWSACDWLDGLLALERGYYSAIVEEEETRAA